MERITPGILTDPDVVRFAARISVWGRWFVWFAGTVMLARRPDLWYPDQIGYVFLNVSLFAINGVVHHRLLTNRPITWRWMLGLSAADIGLITANIAVSGNFDNVAYVAYYPSLAVFAVVFSSLWVILAWVTATAVLYSLVTVMVSPGLHLEMGQDNLLVARLFVMFLIAVGVSLIVRFERNRWQSAVSRERHMRQERIDLSQKIHDTTAQTAYMIGLGLDRARELAGDSNQDLTAALEATYALSRSAMWEIRDPIDQGQLVDGRELGRVLWSHCATFEMITAIPTEMSQSGDEPPLATVVRTGLFGIAHNALTNAFRHSGASKVQVRLIFEADRISLSVSDDGIGLPPDYAKMGRGFRGMEAGAERMGGVLDVQSNEQKDGTTVTCDVPLKKTTGNS